MGKRSIMLLALVLVALAALAVPGESQAPIKIGVIEPLSGPVAASATTSGWAPRSRATG